MAEKNGGSKKIVEVPTVNLSEAMLQVEEEETELDKILSLLLDPRNINHNTELSRNEITAFSVLSTISKRHQLPVLEQFLIENLEKRVSKGRAGRKEWVKIVGRHLAQDDENRANEARGIGRFFRRR